MNAYNPNVHTHVVVKDMFDGHPVEIILVTGGFVWVPATYADDAIDDVVQVGDGRTNGFDQDGNRVLSIPVRLCTFHDPVEAEGIEMMKDADDQLLAYAR